LAMTPYLAALARRRSDRRQRPSSIVRPEADSAFR
jgi:hypothetical protein